jgi:hypothetical protein
MRVVREHWFSIDLSRLWGGDLGMGGERGATYGGATDNQTRLIHDRFNMTRARSLCDNTRQQNGKARCSAYSASEKRRIDRAS